jgi:hypothetical protein
VIDSHHEVVPDARMKQRLVSWCTSPIAARHVNDGSTAAVLAPCCSNEISARTKTRRPEARVGSYSNAAMAARRASSGLPRPHAHVARVDHERSLAARDQPRPVK